ncbi:hypothetical protein V1294_006368 [Bradyrhizobium sp. AZCC 1678]
MVSWKKGRPRKGDQRGTKPRSRPLAPIGGSNAAHFRVITRCINETRWWFDSRFSMSEFGQAVRCCLSAAFLAGSPDGANGSRECAPGDERNCARTVMTGSAQSGNTPSARTDPGFSFRFTRATRVSPSSPSGRRWPGRPGSAAPGRRRWTPRHRRRRHRPRTACFPCLPPRIASASPRRSISRCRS